MRNILKTVFNSMWLKEWIELIRKLKGNTTFFIASGSITPSQFLHVFTPSWLLYFLSVFLFSSYLHFLTSA